MSTSVLPYRPMTAVMPPLDRFGELASFIRSLATADEVVLLTTMPRGGLQICKKLHLNDALVRRYNSELHPQDAFSWRVLREGWVDGSVGTDQPGSPIAHGLTVSLGVRIESPVFDGYPGVLLVLRRVTQPARPLQPAKAAADIRSAFDRFVRRDRQIIDASPRQYIFTADGAILPEGGLAQVDPKLVESIQSAVQPRLAPDFQGEANSGRVGLADSSGVHVPVEIVRFAHYPALSEQPVVFVSIHPRVQDWQKVTPEDFSADPELARLTAAVNFMVKSFRRGPTLEEVAEAVHLSQFHFHRRFSEIFGLTPKHLLYDLQLHEAQRMLADPQQQLVDIAKHCGFAHQSHFTSRFKQGTGLTPTRWRRQVVTFHDA
ncbi:MAG: helix-turn-helix transcriptional regulator [Tepidisphaeraceae bacterium]